MRKLTLLFALCGAGALVGCSGSSTTDGGTTGSTGSTGDAGNNGDDDGGFIAVSGTVALNPVVGAAIDAGLFTGTIPAFAGETLFIDEPLIATAQGVEAGRLATSTLDSSGTFDVPLVPLENIQIGLVATIAGKSDDGGYLPCEDTNPPAFCDDYARSVSLVYENFRPTADVTGVPILGVPVQFTELLSANLGLAQGEHLLDKGFVIGYVVQSDGGPLAGATFDDHGQAHQIIYLDDTLNPNANATSTNKFGMFLVVAPGQPSPSTTYGIVNHPEFGCHRLGSNKGTVLSLVYDGARPGIACQ
ncbi:MAG: hypothetical protein JST54_35340 [Deltaproteobacteria bacterium]|nr:hypothetical protein [Deltaproteobacteria bacterium]